MESSESPAWMKFQRKGTQFYSVETLQNHTDSQLPGQKGSNEHEDTLWKALLSLDSGVWPSTKWQLLRVPSCLWSTESLGQVGLRWLRRTESPLSLAHLGWVGWEHRGEALWTTKALCRGAEPWVWGRGKSTMKGSSTENMGTVSLERHLT